MSESIGDKLRRLKRESPAESNPVAPKRVLPDWLKGKLGRAVTDPSEVGRLEDPVELVDHPEGFASRVRCFELGHVHGAGRLDEVLDVAVDRSAPSRLTGDAALDEFDFASAVYLDIEATGLSGGAGTIPFQVGLGRFTETSFELWQGFLRGPEQEAAMLREVAERVRAAAGVVSFFGKSYDRHRLEDKMRLHGIDAPFDETPHLDLFHPLARLTKGSLPDAKLSRLERELVGVTREDDLPGSFAPAAWFDFLRGRPHRLEEVFQHNQDDVLSLVLLAGYLGTVERERRVDGEPLAGCDRTRAKALARWFAKARDDARARDWIALALEREPDPEAHALAAELARRAGDVASAIQHWREVGDAAPSRLRLDAEVALAKLLEHKQHDFDGARRHTERAVALLEAGALLASESRAKVLRGELERRLTRLAARS